MQKQQQWLGVDTGGTFTDFVLYDGTQVHIHKVLSTPEAPEKAVIAGCEYLALNFPLLELVHGSTVATNAVLEGKGVKTLYITNQGFADTLSIGRQARAEIYNLQPSLSTPPVPKELCIEVGGRCDAQGNLLSQLSEADLQEIDKILQAERPQAVAINLLFSFMNDEVEQKIKAHLPQALFISCSSEVLAEYREYERGIATWLNAWIGPLLQKYLSRLEDKIKPHSFNVMQSTGGTIGVVQAADNAVNLLLSGPAGGLKGAQYMAGLSGYDRIMTFDMGGTSTDVALIDKEIVLSRESYIASYPVAVPMVDMFTIGAGGGSIAQVDQAGLLQVGPESAGAQPGPACYALGGKQATVTDANLFLGRLPSLVVLAGGLELDVTQANVVLTILAKQLDISVLEVANGIIDLANEHMVRALRVISVEKGFDPQDFTLVSFGGAGGLHVCALADALGMKTCLIPKYAGVLSALGMIVSPQSREMSQSIIKPLAQVSLEIIENNYKKLVDKAKASFAKDNIKTNRLDITYSLDLRYLGQSYYLNIKWNIQIKSEAAKSEIEKLFHRQHASRFGHRLEQEIELVNLRVHLTEYKKKFELVSMTRPSNRSRIDRKGDQDEILLIERDQIGVADIIVGPAIITEAVATSYLAMGWTATMDDHGNLILRRN